MAFLGLSNPFHQHIKGLCRAVVEDNYDPEGRNRLRVRIPSLHGHPQVHGEHCLANDQLPWAEMCSLSAGPGRGTSIIPNKGDRVWVAFEDGKRTKPVVMGSFFTPAPTNAKKDFDAGAGLAGPGHSRQSTGGEPAPNESAPKNTSKDNVTSTQILYKSKKGAELGFYEEDQKETFRITDSIGQIIEFGSHSPKGSPARSSGDRTRKPVKPDGIYGQGYILIQIAGDDEKESGGFTRVPDKEKKDKIDPKFLLAPDTVHLENGTSKISAEFDHIVLHNGKGALDIVGANIKLSNEKSSIDIISPNKDNDENGETVKKDEDELIAITNGSGCTMTMQGKDLSIRVDGNIFIQAEGSLTLGAEKDIGILAGQNMAIGAGKVLSMSSGGAMFINSGATITEVASGVIIMRGSIINLN